MNLSLKRSGVCGRIRFVNSYTAADYTGPETVDSAYDHLKDPHDQSLGAQAHRLRDQYAADLVVLLVDQELRGGGKGDYTTTLDHSSGEFAYSVADVQGIHQDSVSHELGHNLGLAHDRRTIAADPTGTMSISTTRPYNTGWITPDGKYRTIMAYEESCRSACRQISRFANPEQTYKGQPLGDASNDNARVLRQTLPIVAGYRTARP
ncbi:M12 family metallo-peptidase [Streptomyces sp. NPDC051561]|uniref:M12 family metallo-peptidase n=1 Tax=Streptomyces sp. NPDC051561 TaxID=3365658 RepID=UPI0037BB0C82